MVEASDCSSVAIHTIHGLEILLSSSPTTNSFCSFSNPICTTSTTLHVDLGNSHQFTTRKSAFLSLNNESHLPL